MSFTISKTLPVSAASLRLATTAANFPALKHAFPYSGCNFVARTITDPINGAVAAFDTLTNNGSTFSAIYTAYGTTGLIAPGTADALVIGVMSNCTTLGNFIIGNITDATYTIGTGVTSTTVRTNAGLDFVTNAAASVPNPSTSICCATSVVWSSSACTKYVVESTDSVVVTNTGTPTNSISEGILTANWEGVQEVAFSGNPSSKWYGGYVFYFTNGLPSAQTITAGVAWMAKNPGYIYPGFRNMA